MIRLFALIKGHEFLHHYKVNLEHYVSTYIQYRKYFTRDFIFEFNLFNWEVRKIFKKTRA
jgi:hypothetical protein